MKRLRLSRAGRSRLHNTGPLPPPLSIRPPIVQGDLWSAVIDFASRVVTAPGLTLTVVPGLWEVEGGVTEVTGGWYLTTGGFVGAGAEYLGDAPTLVVPPDTQGKSVSYVEVGERGGTTVTRYSSAGAIRIIEAPAPILSQSLTEFGGWKTVGQTISKPDYTWVSLPVLLPLAISGEWYRNGAATGITTPTITGAEGDLLQWAETAVNASGISATGPDWVLGRPGSYALSPNFAAYVSDKVGAYRNHIRNQVLSRIADKPGGALNMNWFNSHNHGAGSYVVNPDFWAQDLRPQLCANRVAMHLVNGAFSGEHGGPLVTPRHCLSAGHVRGGPGDRRLHRYITPTGKVVEAMEVACARVSELLPGVIPGMDLEIALLDRDLEVEGVPVLPILELDGVFGNFLRDALREDLPLPFLGLSQSQRDAPADTIFAAYPPRHERLLYIKSSHDFRLSTPEFAHFNYGLYPGDSGTPNFYLINDHLFLGGINTNAPFGGPAPGGTYRPEFFPAPAQVTNFKLLTIQAFEALDQVVLAAGKISEASGLLPTFVTIDEAFDYEMPSVSDGPALPYREWRADPTKPAVSRVATNPALPVIGIYSDRSGEPGALVETLANQSLAGSVVEGPLHNPANGVWWYRVTFDNGIAGWLDAAHLLAP
jgi:hypothetical protein